jgi:UDP-N-acetyl-D-galactosamine dehydrogenase
MLKKGIQVKDANVLVMGLTFKENCPDLRNTRVVDIVSELNEYNMNVDILDPWCSNEGAQNEYGLSVIKQAQNDKYDGIILAVAHNEFKVMGADVIKALGKKDSVVYDLKYVLPKNAVDLRL